MIPLGTPYKKDFSDNNIQIVKNAVAERFPDFAAECQPGINVLTLKAWNHRGFKVKKGEKAICLSAPVTRKDDKGKEAVERFVRAYVFALPQVEQR
jgi:hypothetical protein